MISIWLEYTNIMRNHVFVGLVDATYGLVQHSTQLYLLHLPTMIRALFYCLFLRKFCNYGRLRFSKPLNVATLIEEYQTLHGKQHAFTLTVCSAAHMAMRTESMCA